MIWTVCAILSAVSLAASTVLAIGFGASKNGKRLLTPLRVLLCGVFLAAILLFVPIYAASFYGERWADLKTILLSVHNTFRLFAIDSDFEIMSTSTASLHEPVRSLYSLLGAVIYVLSPILTFGFVLSLFKTVTSYVRYLLHFNSDAFIFSKLSERSLALAQSIAEGDKHAVIVFTEVSESSIEGKYELISVAKRLNAICFKKEPAAINFKCHSRRSKLAFFMIGVDENENIEQALAVLPAYHQMPRVDLYVFATRIESELLLSAARKGMVKVRRIDEAHSLIARTMFESGEELFQGAAATAGGNRLISATILGMGTYGTEMIKTLSWFCQMNGYVLQIDAFDKDEKAGSRFAAACPELMSEKHNGTYVEGDAQYKINIHSGVDVNENEFLEKINEIPQMTYAFVALGSDTENIKAAVTLRMLFERKGIRPTIKAVVQNTYKKEALKTLSNFRGQPYDICFIGDMKSSYSKEVIINSEMEEEALARHLKWGNEDEFWAYAYNYRSSVASALHARACEACGIAGATRAEKDLTEEERAVIEFLEHKRWNAYMRAEGYIYSGSHEKSSRNDLAKMHHNIVPFDELSEEDRRKDGKVGTK